MQELIRPLNGLKRNNYDYQDVSDSANNTFKVTDLSDKFLLGKNSFKLHLKEDILVFRSQVYIDILDSFGNPVYYKIISDNLPNKERIVAVYIYDSTPVGDCEIIIAGRLNIDPRTGLKVPYSNDVSSPDYHGIPNVVWRKVVQINPQESEDRIYYSTPPTVTYSEVRKPQYQLSTDNRLVSLVPTSSGRATMYSNRGQLTTTDTIKAPAGGHLINSDTGSATFIPIAAANNDNEIASLYFSGFTLSSSMEGGRLFVNNISYSYPSDAFVTQSRVINYSGSIVKVVSENLCYVNPPLYQVIPYTDVNGNSKNLVVEGFSEMANFTASFRTEPTITTDSSSYNSYIKLQIKNTEPEIGSVKSISVKAKQINKPGKIVDLGTFKVDKKNILIVDSDTYTMTSRGIEPLSLGNLRKLGTVSNYWTGSNTIGLSNEFTRDSGVLDGAKYLSTFEAIIPTEEDYGEFRLKSQYFPTVYADTEYQLSFDILIGSTPPPVIPAQVDVYISGSDVVGSNYIRNAFLSPLKNTRFGTYIGSIDASKTYRHSVKLYFTAEKSGNVTPVFVNRCVNNVYGNIELSVRNEPGYSSKFLDLEVPLPTEFNSKSEIELEIDFLNSNNESANYKSSLYGVVFQGNTPQTGSGNAAVIPPGTVSGSDQLTGSFDGRYETRGRGIVSGSNQITEFGFVNTSSIYPFTGSTNTRLNIIEQTTGSLNSYTGSANTRFNLIEIKTGSYATTGSNTFIGNQKIVGYVTASAISSSYFDFDRLNNGNAPTWKEGRIYYDFEYGAFSAYNDSSDIVLRIGQESLLRVFNNSGTTITKGSAVKVSGSQGDYPYIYLAKSEIHTSSYVHENHIIGLASHDILTGAPGYVTQRGTVRNIDTSTLVAGDVLFLSSSAGQLTATPPTYPNEIVRVGYVIRSHANGIIFVSPSAPIHIKEINSFSSSEQPRDKDLWVYKSSIGGWYNTNKDLELTGSFSGSFNGMISGSGQVKDLLPSGTVSGSTQLTSSYDTRYERKGTGIFSSSAQIGPTGIYSSSGTIPRDVTVYASNVKFQSSPNVSNYKISYQYDTIVTEGNLNSPQSGSFSYSTGDELDNFRAFLNIDAAGPSIEIGTKEISASRSTSLLVTQELSANFTSQSGESTAFTLASPDGTVFYDSRNVIKGMEYGGNYTASLINRDRSIPDVGTVKKIVSGSTFQTGSFATTGSNLFNGSQSISGSLNVSQSITANNYTGVFNGQPSSSAQIKVLLPTGTVSGSEQLTSSYDTRYERKGTGIVSSSQQINNLIPNIVSSSVQLTSSYDTRYHRLGTGVLSGSAQIATEISGAFTQTSSSLAGRIGSIETKSLYSSSLQVDYNQISNKPVVSGSGLYRILLSSGSASSSYSHQNLKYDTSQSAFYLTGSTNLNGNLFQTGSTSTRMTYIWDGPKVVGATPGIEWTNQPAAVNTWLGTSGTPTLDACYIGDFTEITQGRLYTGLSTIAGSTTCSLEVQYSLDGASSWTPMVTLTVGNVIGHKDSGWARIPDGSRTFCYIRLVGWGGDGLRDPRFSPPIVLFR